MPQPTKHVIRWFVYAGSERIPRTATMRGQWGYDVECSCGWKTTTGGATQRYITDEVWHHKWSNEAKGHEMDKTIATCQWYVLCYNLADFLVTHPVLGDVPTCRRCAAKHDLFDDVTVSLVAG